MKRCKKRIPIFNHIRMSLPEPTHDALAASNALLQRIAQEVERNAGWISWSRYMEMALYEPILGYYSGGATKLGRDGDFTTSPEITPLFGAALAHAVAPLMAQTSPRILEFGAGSGKLAFDLLSELAAEGIKVESYAILELSAELRQRQQRMLDGFPQVVWLDCLPEAFSGVVIGNEVLDAMPVKLVTKASPGWHEMGVSVDERRLVVKSRDCGPALLEQIKTQIPEWDTLPDGYTTEVHPFAAAFMHSLGSMLAAGEHAAAILIDYGFPAKEYYMAQRGQGTLMCHYRHHAHTDPFFLPGLQDISAHVDFSLVARLAIESGLDVLCYTGQAAFLLAAGIGELLLRTSPQDAGRYLPQARAVGMLLSPAEMGELFKVIVVGKNVSLSSPYCRHDQSDRL